MITTHHMIREHFTAVCSERQDIHSLVCFLEDSVYLNSRGNFKTKVLEKILPIIRDKLR